jgi:hypothetical protein
MKKYLRELELSGLILIIIGIICTLFWGYSYGVGPCSLGLLLWLITFLYKAFRWNEYARENRQNILILILTILIITIKMLFR